LASLAILLLATLNMTYVGRAAIPSETAATSKLAGFALPQSAERILDAKAIKESTDPLGAVAAQMDIPMQVQAAEVFGWGGAGYKREKGPKIIAQVQTALQKAGFQTQRVGDPQTAQGNTVVYRAVDGSATGCHKSYIVVFS
jgi:hypothetical protein